MLIIECLLMVESVGVDWCKSLVLLIGFVWRCCRSLCIQLLWQSEVGSVCCQVVRLTTWSFVAGSV